MHYLLLLANAPDAWTDAEAGTPDGVIEDWATYTRALHEAGVLIAGAGLASPHAATAVRVRGGKRLLTDGPFVDAKEHLIGFYVLDCPDLDAALAWAARVPNVRTGVVEVRPITPGQRTVDTLAALGIPVTREL